MNAQQAKEFSEAIIAAKNALVVAVENARYARERDLNETLRFYTIAADAAIVRLAGGESGFLSPEGMNLTGDAELAAYKAITKAGEDLTAAVEIAMAAVRKTKERGVK